MMSYGYADVLEPMTPLTKEELISLAPENASTCFARGDGTVSFYSDGSHKLSETTNGKCYVLEGYDIPGIKEFIAIKKESGEWYWYKNKDKEATKVIESLGYVWDSKYEKWEEQSEGAE